MMKLSTLIGCLSIPFLALSQDDVQLSVDISNRLTEMSNGIISLTINSKGQVNTLSYGDQDLMTSGGRFYMSYNEAAYHELSPNLVKVAQQTSEIAEVIYENTSGPLLIEQGFIMLKGVSGLYTYINVKAGSQIVDVRELRVVHRVSGSLFDYAYTSDKVQGPMVSPTDLKNSTEIMDATYQLTDGSIYTKYNWANYVADDIVHGLVDTNINTGVWIISSSDEYLNGGPMKQELMVHGTDKTPLALKMLQGEHFGASSQIFAPGEGKMYGPYFIYINDGNNKEEVIADAKQVATDELELWPYDWMTHEDFPLNRSVVSGQITTTNQESVDSLVVVLAKPDGTLYSQGKDYMFWSSTDENGFFNIPHVREGNYSLYAFATSGEITDEFKYDDVSVSGDTVKLNSLEWTTSNNYPILWSIGKSDRKASEFNLGQERRRFGMWEDVPADLQYTIGTSNPSSDWYYAQTQPGDWDVIFNMDSLTAEKLVLTIAVAGAASEPKVLLYMNDQTVASLGMNNDASVYRSANTGGLFVKREFEIAADKLVLGENKLTFRLNSVGSRGGIMYDFIKLQASYSTSEEQEEEEEEEEESVLGSQEYGQPEMIIYPNPSYNQEQITIEFNLDTKEFMDLRIHDLSGKQVRIVKQDLMESGKQNITLDTQSLPAGIYYINLKTQSISRSQKLVILR